MDDHGSGSTGCPRAIKKMRSRSQQLEKPKRKVFDWISHPELMDVTPFQQFILDVDWEKSPIGPMKDWPAQLRQMVLLVVQDPAPAVVYWGDEATIVYNEPYTHLIGEKHPALQGQDPSIEFAEIWDHFETLLARQRDTAETTVEANAPLLLFRHGFLEETYFSWKFVPIIGDDGWVVGSHATVVEVTREVVGDRRMGVVRTLSQQLSSARCVKDIWTKIIDSFTDAAKDIPMAILYTVADSSMKATIPARSGNYKDATMPLCILEGAIGIPKGHPAAPETLDLNEEHTTCVATALKQALIDRSSVLVPVTGEVLDEFKGIEWRGHSYEPTQLMAYPIIPTDSPGILSFIIVALNPHRPWDEDYRDFLHLLTQQVTQPQLSAVILREEVERRQNLARQEALDRDRLTRQLSDSEAKFARFASRAPIGLAILTPEGTALSANHMWRDLTKLEVGTSSVDWGDVLADGYMEPVMEGWSRMLQESKPVTMQTRMKRLWRVPELDSDGKVQWTETHILLAMYPDQDENGEVFSVMSCITDVSELKWNEIQLRERMEQAIEIKKQQERFIDMTSHEMRNPLSALIGCADEIIASLTDYRALVLPGSSPASPLHSRNQSASNSHTNLSSLSLNTLVQPTSSPLPASTPTSNRHLIDEAIEAADTIIYCAMHQKRIIDDILTLSRLDSNLLLVSPSPSQPIPLIRSALKMFEAELKRASTSLLFTEHKSLSSLSVSWTLLDPSRVLQVFINLMTNAIKFTRTEKIREIKVEMAASLQRPSEHDKGTIEWVQRSRIGSPSADQTSKAEWGDGEVIYISITVTDTGRGLTKAEIKNLFHLFAQASPKTHQTYGGSGLGLFISCQLVNMQGGEIGVQSRAGKGSTFTFYIKTRRTQPEEAELEEAERLTSPVTARPTMHRNRSLHAQNANAKSFSLLVREDALREACAAEISALQNGGKMPNVQLEQTRSITPGLASPLSSVKEMERGYLNGKSARGKAYAGEVGGEKKVWHILVVEDNLVNQKVVCKQLRKSGHVVSVANHGEEALEFIRRSEYWVDDAASPSPLGVVNGNENGNGGEVKQGERLHVVLMDLEMPVMDGLTCVRRIRDLQLEGRIRDHIPVIAVTANARKDQIMNSYEAGMDDVTTKPYRMVDMLKQIDKLVAKRASQMGEYAETYTALQVDGHIGGG